MRHRKFVWVGDVNVSILNVSPDVSRAAGGFHRYPSTLINVNSSSWVGSNVILYPVSTVIIRTRWLVTPLLTKDQDVGVPGFSSVGLGNLHVNGRTLLEVNRLVPGIITTGHCDVKVGRFHVQGRAICHRKSI